MLWLKLNENWISFSSLSCLQSVKIPSSPIDNNLPFWILFSETLMQITKINNSKSYGLNLMKIELRILQLDINKT